MLQYICSIEWNSNFLKGMGHLESMLLGKHEKPEKRMIPRTSILMVLFGANIKTFFVLISFEVPARDF